MISNISLLKVHYKDGKFITMSLKISYTDGGTCIFHCVSGSTISYFKDYIIGIYSALHIEKARMSR